jgi:hypothetical protein
MSASLPRSAPPRRSSFYTSNINVLLSYVAIVSRPRYPWGNTGSDRSQLAKVALQAKDILGADHLDAVARWPCTCSPTISRGS